MLFVLGAENPMTVMPYKVNKSINESYERNKFDEQNNLYSVNSNNNQDIEIENEENLNTNSDNNNFEDVMKRTHAEYAKEEENANDNIEDDMNMNNNEENNNIYRKPKNKKNFS